MEHNKNADGLRGIAALNVAICHFMAAFMPSVLHRNWPNLYPPNPHPGPFQNFLQFPLITLFFNGTFAVFVFFVLSGYVLTLPYYAEDQQKLKSRLWGRYFRLNIPVAASIMISFFVYKFGFYYNTQASYALNHSFWLGLSVDPNLSWLDASKIALYEALISARDILSNGPLWTVRMEFICSIMLLAYYLTKSKNRNYLPSLIICIYICLIGPQESNYFVAMLLGSLLGLKRVSQKVLIVFFCVGIYFGSFVCENAAYNFLPNIPFWDKKNFYNTIGAVFLVWSVVNGFAKDFFTSGLLGFLGKISYSLFLLHCISLNSWVCWLYITLPNAERYLAAIFILYISVSLVLAYFFYKFVDGPAIRLSHKFSKWMVKA